MVQRYLKGRKQTGYQRLQEIKADCAPLRNWIAYRGHVEAYRFNNKRQLSLDRLNLEPTYRLAKNKPKWKEDKQRKSQQKGRWKAIIQLVVKDTEWPNHFLGTKRKGNCKSAYLWRKVHILYIQKIQILISQKEEMEVNSLFSKLRPNYQLEVFLGILGIFLFATRLQ